MTSTEWMDRVQETAAELSEAREKCERGEITPSEYTRALGRYRHAVRKYTDPFGVKR